MGVSAPMPPSADLERSEWLWLGDGHGEEVGPPVHDLDAPEREVPLVEPDGAPLAGQWVGDEEAQGPPEVEGTDDGPSKQVLLSLAPGGLSLPREEDGVGCLRSLAHDRVAYRNCWASSD